MKSKNKKASHSTSDLKHDRVKEEYQRARKWLHEIAEQIRKEKETKLAG